MIYNTNKIYKEYIEVNVTTVTCNRQLGPLLEITTARKGIFIGRRRSYGVVMTGHDIDRYNCTGDKPGYLLPVADAPAFLLERTIKMKKPLIYVCSPLAGDFMNNIERAARYCRFVSSQNAIPIAPHLYFTRFLDDAISEERDLGVDMGLDVLGICDAVWVFGSKISTGMKREILLAKEIGKPVQFFDQMCQRLGVQDESL